MERIRKLRLPLLLLLIVMIGATSACSTKDQGVGIAAGQKALYIGSTKEQVIEIFSPEIGHLIGQYRFKLYHFSGYEISRDGRKLFVYGSREDDILVFDTTTGKEIDRFTVDKGVQKIILSDDRIVFLQNQQTIQFIDMKGKTKGEAITLPDAIKDFQLSNDQKSLYLIHAKTDQVSRLNIEQRKVTKTWDTISNPTMVWENQKMNELWVGGHGSLSHIQAGIARYSMEDGHFIGEIPSGEMPIRFYHDESTDALFAVSHGSNHLMKVNAEGRILAETITGINPYALDSDGESLYVASYDSQLIKVYKLDTLAEVTQFPVGFHPLWLKYRGEVESQ